MRGLQGRPCLLDGILLNGRAAVVVCIRIQIKISKSTRIGALVTGSKSSAREKRLLAAGLASGFRASSKARYNGTSFATIVGAAVAGRKLDFSRREWSEPKHADRSHWYQ